MMHYRNPMRCIWEICAQYSAFACAFVVKCTKAIAEYYFSNYKLCALSAQNFGCGLNAKGVVFVCWTWLMMVVVEII